MKFLVPADRNITIKEKEKNERYKSLIRELRRLCLGYSDKVIVLISGTVRDAKPSMKRNIKAPGNHW